MRNDLSGRVFGRLTAITPVDARREGKVVWRCRCSCGTVVEVISTRLTSGINKSCGCLRKEGNQRTHGGRHTPEYSVWRGMRSRCNNPRASHFADYGGRGISVCARWNSFETFLADMGARPSPAHSIDRINNSLGYSPENCRWATIKQQQRNRRSNLLITVGGVSATFAEHCEGTGVKYATAHRRLKQGASIEVAISPDRPAYGTIENKDRALNITLAAVLRE